jgi:hypothetical protein
MSQIFEQLRRRAKLSRKRGHSSPVAPPLTHLPMMIHGHMLICKESSGFDLIMLIFLENCFFWSLIIQRIRNADINRASQWTVMLLKRN